MAQKLLKWLVLLALILFIVAVVLFLFGGSSFSESDVILDLEGPTQASVGDGVVYKVKYGNNTSTDLSDLKFRFIYPEESVVIKDGQVVKGPDESFTLEKLESRESGEKEFSLFLVGDRGNIKNAKVELEFKAEGIRSSFQKEKTISTTLVNVPVSLTLVAPPTVAPGQIVNYILDYRNESGEDISDVRLEFQYSEDFQVQNQTPKSSEENIWFIPVLKKGEGGRINLTGVLKGEEGEVKVISVSLKRKFGNDYITSQKSTTSSVVSTPLLSVESFVNDSKNYTAHLGDKLQYKIRYKNNSKSNLLGLSLEAKLEGEMYDVGTLDTKGGFYDSSAGTILWNAGSVSELASLPPGKSGEVGFGINIKDAFPSGNVGARNFAVKVSARISTPNVPSGVEGDEVSAVSSLLTRISTKPSFLQTVYYNDPSFGSSGPLPLKTGEETFFTVHWQINNPGGDMNKAKVTAVLPTGITWKNVVSIGLGQAEPTFNSNSSAVVWDIATLPQGTGLLTPKYEASFRVSVKPSIAGETPVIIKEARFSGTDTFTKEDIVINAPDLNTDDMVDRPGEGMVQ